MTGINDPAREPVRLLIVSDIDELIGRNLVTVEGARIGSIGQVHADVRSGRPEWVSVRSGSKGTRESLVPVSDLLAVGADIAVPFTQHQIADSPAGVHDHDGHLSEASVAQLQRYYAMAGRANANLRGPEAAAGSGTNGAEPVSGAFIPLRTEEEVARFDELSARGHAEADRRRKARKTARS